MLAPHVSTSLADRHGRVKRKLRVSLTDRCNFRCPYCMPVEPDWAPRDQLLTRPELFRLIRLFVTRLGINQIRLTGGEPLLRPDLEECIAELGLLRDSGLDRISLTTNGSLLAARAASLKDAGLDDLNVSLDALEPAPFHALSGGRSSPEEVIAGIEAARIAGLPVKTNAVIMRDRNSDQVLPLARWACSRNIPLRFIEFMPLDGRGAWSQERVVTEAEILTELRREFTVTAVPRTNDPATYYELDGRYRLGIISTISNPFCSTCDRVRVTATGELYSCLFSSHARELRQPLREGVDDEQVLQLIRSQVWNKPTGYQPGGYVERPITMHSLGG